MSTHGLKLLYVTVDVFTNTRFLGNPLAIVKVPKQTTLSQEEKQTIAVEFNYSETVFLHEASGSERVWTIDIFTTERELSFAGHPTIGTACYLGFIHPDLHEGTLITKAGPIPFTLQRNAHGHSIGTATAAIPQDIHLHQQSVTIDQLRSLQPGISDGVNLPESSPAVSCTNGLSFALFKMESENDLQSVKASTIQPLKSLVTLDDGWAPHQFSSYYYVLESKTPKDGKMRAKTRMIDGMLEDPATGSAACTLAAYLTFEQAKAGPLDGRSLEFEIEQGVHMGRASNIGVKVVLKADSSIENIFLTGSSILVMSGELIK